MRAETAIPADAPAAVDLAALSPGDRLRVGAFRLFARLLASAPDAPLFVALREAQLLRGLTDIAVESGSPVAGQLEALGDWLDRADAHAFEAARRDFLALFVATRHLAAPPWESVYCSNERLVNQEPAREVLRAYAEARLGFDGMKEVPADHISLELEFAAALIGEAANSEESARRLRVFEEQHLMRWVPQFCADLARASTSDLYRSVAAALPLLLPSAPRV